MLKKARKSRKFSNLIIRRAKNFREPLSFGIIMQSDHVNRSFGHLFIFFLNVSLALLQPLQYFLECFSLSRTASSSAV